MYFGTTVKIEIFAPDLSTPITMPSSSVISESSIEFENVDFFDLSGDPFEVVPGAYDLSSKGLTYEILPNTFSRFSNVPSDGFNGMVISFSSDIIRNATIDPESNTLGLPAEFFTFNSSQIFANYDNLPISTGAGYRIALDFNLVGGAGFDTLVGGDGNDLLDGGANPTTQGDILIGGLGNDTYIVDSALDLVDEGIVFGGAAGGTDEIISKADFFWDFYSAGDILRIAEDAVDDGGDGTTAVGSVFSNFMIGNSGTNILFGRGGSDTYKAGDGIDFISLSTLGLTDANAYAGVDGVNTIIVEQRMSGPVSYDIIFEFEAGKDKVNVADYAGVNGLSSGADVVARAVDDGIGNSYIALGDGLDYLYMVGLEKADLQAGDFIVA